MTHNRQRKKRSQNKRYGAFHADFVFTTETVAMTLAALKLLDEPFQRRIESTSEKYVFAQETLHRVRQKFHAMAQSLGAICLTTFDYNEKLIIALAMQIYIHDLCLSPEKSRRIRELEKCQQIVEHFLPAEVTFPVQD